MSNKISYEEFIQRLKEKTDTIIPISEYIGWGKPMTYRCLVCGNEWKVSEASSFLLWIWMSRMRKRNSK